MSKPILIDTVEKMYEIFGRPEGFASKTLFEVDSLPNVVHVDGEWSANPEFLKKLTQMPKPRLRSIDDDWIS